MSLGFIFNVDITLIDYFNKYAFDERDPIDELFAYLFTNTDTWDEPLIFSKNELHLRHLHLLNIKKCGVLEYLKQCSIKLDQSDDYLEKRYFYYIKHIDKLLKLI